MKIWYNEIIPFQKSLIFSSQVNLLTASYVTLNFDAAFDKTKLLTVIYLKNIFF